MKPKPQFHRVLVAWVDRLLSINGGALEMMAEMNVLLLGDFLISIFISFMIELGLLVFLALFLFEKMMVQSLVLVLGLGCYFGFGGTKRFVGIPVSFVVGWEELGFLDRVPGFLIFLGFGVKLVEKMLFQLGLEFVGIQTGVRSGFPVFDEDRHGKVFFFLFFLYAMKATLVIGP